jgi:hypothetical protein
MLVLSDPDWKRCTYHWDRAIEAIGCIAANIIAWTFSTCPDRQDRSTETLHGWGLPWRASLGSPGCGQTQHASEFCGRRSRRTLSSMIHNYKVQYHHFACPLIQGRPLRASRTDISSLPLPLLALLVKHARLLAFLSGSRRLPSPSFQHQESQTLSLRNHCMGFDAQRRCPAVLFWRPSLPCLILQGRRAG